jgi:hypothetical protein
MIKKIYFLTALCSLLTAYFLLLTGCGGGGFRVGVAGGSSGLPADSGDRYIYKYNITKSAGKNSVVKIGVAHSLTEVQSRNGTLVTGALVQRVGSLGPAVSTGADGKFNLRSFSNGAGSGDICARFIVTTNDGNKPFTFNDILVNLGAGYFGTLQAIQIIPPNVTLNPGESYSFFVYGYDEHNYPLWIPTPSWSNSNATVGSVDSLGVFQAVGVGGTVLTATYQGKTARATVTVQGGSPGTNRVTGTVKDNQGNPLPNSFAMVMPQNPLLFVPNGIAIADNNGAYSINKLPQGTYYAYAFGYKGTDPYYPYYSSLTPAALPVNGEVSYNFACTGSGTPPPPPFPPSIDSLSPNQGIVGTFVTISGSGFGTTQGLSYVNFNGTPAADAEFWSNSRIVCSIPVGAQTGEVKVIVKNNAYTQIPPPVFTVLLPQWTWLVYIDGTNNLEYYGDDDIAEMAQVGSSSNLNILVQQSRSSQGGVAKRLYVNAGSFTEAVNLGVVNMADPNNLKDFITWGMSNYPAQHYVVDLWNHGGGWRDINKGILQDDIFHQIMSMLELKSALSGLPARIDVLACDACLMQMAEVAYQVKDYADYFVASEETIPGEGYPYHTILQAIAGNPNITPFEFASSMVNNYLAAYSSDITLSAVQLNKIADLAAAVNTFAQELYNNFDTYTAQIRSARNGTQSYTYDDYVDLYDFADRIAGVIPSAAGVKTAVGNAVLANGYKGVGLAGSHGISIFFPTYRGPWSADGHNYNELDFIAVSGAAPKWYDFIERYNP